MKIREILAEKKLTSAWLADKVGLSKVAISNIVTEKSSPSVETLLKISEVLNVSITRLLGLDESKDSNTITCPKCGAKFELKE